MTEKKSYVFNKTLFILIILSILMLSSATIFSHAAISTNVNIKINGEIMIFDQGPIIKDDRTLIPVRGVFETLGGEVGWEEKTRKVTVEYAGNKVILTIGSKEATVNEKSRNLDVPASIYSNRTLIPLRFVAEELGFDVGWDPETRTASIDVKEAVQEEPTEKNPEENVPVICGDVTGVSIEEGDSNLKNTIVSIVVNGNLSGPEPYNIIRLENPYRYVVDFPGYLVDKTISDQDWDIESSPVIAVRVGQLNENTVRVVVDLKENSNPKAILSDDGKTVSFSFPKFTQYFKPMDDGRLVVALDPGHGVDTGGKRSPDGTLREYEFNRDIANRIKPILEAKGIEVFLTVEGEKDEKLSQRVEKANNSAADIFVSLHANASGDTWSTAQGWEIYYYPENYFGGELAKFLREATIPKSGMNDRGIKTSDFYVIKHTAMPSVLIEHGFFSNKEEVEKLKNSTWRQMMAECDAEGIVNFLNKYKYK